MYKQLIYIILFILVLGLCEVQALSLEWDRAAYWDGRYPSSKILLTGAKSTEHRVDNHVNVALFTEYIFDIAMIDQVLNNELGHIEADKVGIGDQLPDRGDLEVYIMLFHFGKLLELFAEGFADGINGGGLDYVFVQETLDQAGCQFFIVLEGGLQHETSFLFTLAIDRVTGLGIGPVRIGTVATHGTLRIDFYPAQTTLLNPVAGFHHQFF